MKKYILFLIIIFFLLISCGESFPPDEEDEYIPTIIYRIEGYNKTDSVICEQIQYTNENGDTITLTDVTLPWEYQMEVEDNASVALHAVHEQDPLSLPPGAGIAEGSSGTYFLDDSNINFDLYDDSLTVLNVSITPNILHQISAIISSTRLRLNIDTFTGGETYQLYNRLYYILGIYRIDHSGNEYPLMRTAQLYASMDETLSAYAY